MVRPAAHISNGLKFRIRPVELIFDDKFARKFVVNRVCYMYNSFKGVIIMPNIKPISDLRNYTEVLKEVDASSRGTGF